MLLSVHNSDNADMIAAAMKLYAPDKAVIADVTYGKGAFWTKTDLSPYTFLSSDIRPMRGCQCVSDFRDLPYEDESINIVVLDPPYIHNPGNHQSDGRYGNKATTTGLYHEGIIKLYKEGMEEAVRVLRPGGQLWVKCKDEIEAGKQRWSHIELHNIACELGLYPKDLLILCPQSSTSTLRWARQLHARKVHSYLWIFWKTKAPRSIEKTHVKNGKVSEYFARTA